MEKKIINLIFNSREYFEEKIEKEKINSFSIFKKEIRNFLNKKMELMEDFKRKIFYPFDFKEDIYEGDPPNHPEYIFSPIVSFFKEVYLINKLIETIKNENKSPGLFEKKVESGGHGVCTSVLPSSDYIFKEKRAFFFLKLEGFSLIIFAFNRVEAMAKINFFLLLKEIELKNKLYFSSLKEEEFSEEFIEKIFFYNNSGYEEGDTIHILSDEIIEEELPHYDYCYRFYEDLVEIKSA